LQITVIINLHKKYYFTVTVLTVKKLVLYQLKENRIDNNTNKIMGY